MNGFLMCSTAALAMALAAASFAHAASQGSPAGTLLIAAADSDSSSQPAQKPDVAGQANAMSNPTFSKQRVDGGDLQPDTIFQEKYQRQPVPASK
jgi:hypothetical protein